MKSLHIKFLDELEKVYNIGRLGSLYYQFQFNKLKIQLTSEQLKEIENSILNEDETINFSLTKEQTETANIDELEIKNFLTSDNFISTEQISEFSDLLKQTIQDLVDSITKTTAWHLFKNLKKSTDENDQNREFEQKDAEKKIRDQYRNDLSYIEAMITISTEACTDVIHYNDGAEISGIEPEKKEALSLLLKRACNISNEILVLIKSGYQHGALARWRSLHEISVFITLISQNNNELAICYLDHIWIGEKKEFLQYKEYCSLFNISFENNELEKNLTEKVKTVVEKYGDLFKEDCGWATLLIPNKRITFYDLEKLANLEKFRLEYKIASNAVHAGVKGNYPNPLVTSDHELFFGPNANNMEVPLNLLSYSLLISSLNVLSKFPTIDHLTAMKILIKFNQSLSFNK